MQVVETIAATREARSRFGALGLVPTMGYLHAGHISLVDRARRELGAVAVSIFVNPTQFAAHEDLDIYPRDLDRDLALLAAAGADLVFVPQPAEIYPPGFDTKVEVGRVARPLEGAARPGHFAGVATVVTKLFNIVQPTRAYFGQKDAQQAAVIRRMVRDLDSPVAIVVAPTVREADGLALSSRNAYLKAEERARAPLLHRALEQAAQCYRDGERDAERLRATMRATLATDPAILIDYVSVADADSLEELDRVDRTALVSLAARLGATRLIDNLVLPQES